MAYCADNLILHILASEQEVQQMLENSNNARQIALWTITLKKEHMLKREECRNLKINVNKYKTRELDFGDLQYQLESSKSLVERQKTELQQANRKVVYIAQCVSIKNVNFQSFQLGFLYCSISKILGYIYFL